MPAPAARRLPIPSTPARIARTASIHPVPSHAPPVHALIGYRFSTFFARKRSVRRRPFGIRPGASPSSAACPRCTTGIGRVTPVSSSTMREEPCDTPSVRLSGVARIASSRLATVRAILTAEHRIERARPGHDGHRREREGDHEWLHPGPRPALLDVRGPRLLVAAGRGARSPFDLRGTLVGPLDT